MLHPLYVISVAQEGDCVISFCVQLEESEQIATYVYL